MAVETLTEFPSSFFAGDTVRVAISDSDFPSTLWTLKVLLQSAIESKSFSATAVGGSSKAYTLVISAANSAKIAPGFYIVSFIYTEVSSSERKTGECSFSTTVYSNPEHVPSATIARQTLEAMEAAYLRLVGSNSGTRVSANFNGQSFTNRNLKEFQDAIERQRAVVAAEDQQRTGHRRIARVVHPL